MDKKPSRNVAFDLKASGSFDSLLETSKSAVVENEYKDEVQAQAQAEDEVEDADPHSNSQPTSSSSYITPRERLLQFLNSPQRPFEASADASQSTSSRKPRLFDLHLHRNLRLRRIVVVDDLPERIASVCDQWLSTTHLLFSATANNFPFNMESEEGRQQLYSGKSVKNENTLASSYEISFGKPITTVASSIIFKRSKWESIFQFGFSAREKHMGKKFATPDGFLCVIHDNDKRSAAVLNSLGEVDRDDINTIFKHNLHHILLWEFKSLAAGSKEALDKFVKLEGDFKWPVCNRRKKRQCKDGRHDQDGVLSVTGRKVGFDSRNVKVINDIYSLATKGSSVDVVDQPDSSNSRADRDDVAMEVDEEESSESDTDMSIDSDDESSDPDTDMDSMPDDEAIETTSTSKAVSASGKVTATDAFTPSQAITKKRAGAGDKASRATATKATSKTKKIKNPEHGAGEPEREYKPTSMAVQIWSECVKFDATINVLNAGNYEIICIRCRATNTLYISRVLNVEEAIYKKTQISLHGLAYYDALDRARQLEALEKAANPTFPGSYYLSIQYDPYPPIHKAAAGLLSTSNKRPSGYNDLLEDLGKYGKFDVLLPPFLSSKETKYDLCTLLRLPLPSEPQPSESPTSEPSSSLPLPPSSMQAMKSAWTLELSERITERVYSLVAKNKKASFSDKLIVKVAETRFEYNALLYEYEIHRRFEAESFGIKVFGILEVPDSQMRLLLMEQAGFSLDEIRKKKKVLFARQHKKKYIDAINALHAHRFLHGNLKGGHFLMSPRDGHVSLVSYKPTPLNRSLIGEGEGKADRKRKGNADKKGKGKEDKEFVEGMKIEVSLAKRLKKLI